MQLSECSLFAVRKDFLLCCSPETCRHLCMLWDSQHITTCHQPLMISHTEILTVPNRCCTSHMHWMTPLATRYHKTIVSTANLTQDLPLTVPSRLYCMSNMHWMTRAGPTAFIIKPIAKANGAGMPKMDLPLTVPRRFCCTSNMHWMTRAGPTAFIMKPRAKAKVAGMLKMEMASPPSKNASMIPGTSSSLVAAQPTRLKICNKISHRHHSGLQNGSEQQSTGMLKMEIASPPAENESMIPGTSSSLVAAYPTRLKICSNISRMEQDGLSFSSKPWGSKCRIVGKTPDSPKQTVLDVSLSNKNAAAVMRR